jgi:hypothetical protein
MSDTTDYRQALSEALAARKEWLEKSELPKLKDELRVFQTSFSSLYKIYLKKGLINEDPYKHEVKIGEIETPDTQSFNEANRIDQLSTRLSNYDNQFDFLVNFYQFSVEFLNLDRIKRVLSLVKCINWAHLTPDAATPNTKAIAELTNQVKLGTDPLSSSVIIESLGNLSKSTGVILSLLKELTDYHREVYKLAVRNAITGAMTPGEASQPVNIKKKFAAALPDKPFYPDLIEELVKEDYSKDGPGLRENILKSLKAPDNKPKVVKAAVSFKNILLEGIMLLGSTAATFNEIALKIDENELLLENRKIGFWDKLKRIVQQALNKEPKPVIYEIEYMDTLKGIPVREKINFNNFRNEIDRKVRTLSAIGNRAGGALTRLEAMQEEQLIQFLEKNIREIQSTHKLLNALDDFFKTEVDREVRNMVKGIKPELATIKNSIVRANQKKHEYSAQKEEEEQLKRLGINPGV